ncbi:ABC transporter permease [Phytoactinopolyspora halotolerans]|uniref:ABC transporter permease n=1 Tax=Phytoactinopolyspora halotolerans TaxID=1981512 RepID=A0A6L9SG49_9ACTN|nr:ABC transporter permease [Phytoactinopolyspora halotolerans]NEE04047.1 ABC transporter permease [Phytoactinopolyspora halotolerans]
MGRYIVSRLAQLVIVFFGVTLLIYAAVWALPGDPIRALAGDRPLSESVINALRDEHNLDDPLLVQYLKYMGGLLSGDFGTDFSGRPVWDQMAQRWPVTMRLALTAWVIEAIVGIVLGLIAALRRGRWPDHTILLFSIAVISIPIFVLAYTAQLVLGVNAGIFPVSGISDGWPRSYILPALILAAFGTAQVGRLVRASVLENLRADYVRAAVAKGLSRRRVVSVHVLRNSLIAAVTFLGIELGFLLGGTIVIEGVFNVPGVGQLLFRSLQTQEGAVVVGVATALVLIFLLANLVVDLLYGVLDPRIRHD